jgi:hypothetical protein
MNFQPPAWAQPKETAMPNYCANDLTITGPEAERKRFMAECITYDGDKPRLTLWEQVMKHAGYWNIRNGTTVEHFRDAIKIEIITPRTPVPWDVYDVIAERFPLLVIEGSYYEPMMCIKGDFRISGGKIDVNDESDKLRAEMEA